VICTPIADTCWNMSCSENARYMHTRTHMQAHTQCLTQKTEWTSF
jgi:hypothetical protein